MLFYTSLVFLFIIKACCSWTSGLGLSSNPYYPEETQYITAGYDDNNDTILLFNRRRFVKFKDHKFTEVNEEYLPYSAMLTNSHHAYIQLDDILWMIHYQEKSFVTFNTHTYEYSIPSMGTFRYAYGACFTSSPGFIIIAGGQHVSAVINGDTQFYDISNALWSDGPQLTRRNGGCAVVNNKLYVIGGENTTTYPAVTTDTIVMMDISALPSTTGLVWSTLSDTLSHARSALAVAAYGTDIYAAGGYAYPDELNYVDIIDTLTGNCAPSEPLAFVQSWAASIIVDNVWFLIGGWRTRKYQFLALGPTRAPTKKPTSSPTPAPTPSPTEPPTSQTLNPSTSPTAASTFMPSVSPSNVPSSPPTMNPTMASSAPPTKTPSVPPTKYPTDNPTMRLVTENTVDVGNGDDFTMHTTICSICVFCELFLFCLCM